MSHHAGAGAVHPLATPQLSDVLPSGPFRGMLRGTLAAPEMIRPFLSRGEATRQALYSAYVHGNPLAYPEPITMHTILAASNTTGSSSGISSSSSSGGIGSGNVGEAVVVPAACAPLLITTGQQQQQQQPQQHYQAAMHIPLVK